MNIMIILSLQMTPHGMRFLRFHNVYNPVTDEEEKVGGLALETPYRLLSFSL